MEEYMNVKQTKRNLQTSQKIPSQMIKSGDTFLIRRLDGIDPMIAWAMGSQNGNA